MSSTSGKLWVTATPLGNPGDLSPRAREILGGVALVLAEDTRRSGLLLRACGVTAKRFVSLHDHNEKNRLAPILDELRAGAEAALISDAGTPLISDPGFQLVKACREQGIAVSPVPGPCAPVAALSASGIAPLPFAFLGFPPRSKGDIRQFFAPYAALALTLIFFERKDRLLPTLDIARAVLGNRAGCIAREMTKTYEEFIFFSLGENLQKALQGHEMLGEATLILGPPSAAAVTPEPEVLAIIAEHARLFPDRKPRDMARAVRCDVTGWSVGDIYALLRRS
ncbi:MAG: 16S rRNA (cytidine(1402)-2'-O)-methyltransferase [Deltaproteobacteria bacterium]|jgi:16S rRNA (cytidine1402-2'-O)-methyltransferase|nr:16S rRNA (cytidine(1402)-2'-O)-methyltransferase [Deltaproteobacteria bacterium]